MNYKKISFLLAAVLAVGAAASCGESATPP